MTNLHAVILGAVQGLTEFLPISSSGHLILFPWLLRWPEQSIAFDVALHVGTLLALVVFFWNDWMQILKSQHRLLGFLILGSVPGALFGVFFEDLITGIFRNPVSVACFLIGAGVLIWLAEVISKKLQEIEQLNIWKAIFIGCAQALALLPGISRSGITMTAGLFCGLKREAAARYSFLLATPIIAGAGFYEGFKLLRAGVPQSEISGLLLGILSAAVCGFLGIKYLLKYLQTHTFYVFVWYRVILGIFILALAFFKF